MQPTIIFDHVSKKFSRTYASDSLRDALAKPFKMLFSRDGSRPDKENKEFWALQDVSFDVRPGEALGIIGPNGSGKTTSLKLLSRILRPDGGRIMVHGRVGALIELAAGFNPDLNGRENVFLNATILGMSRHEIQKKYDEIVEFADLYEFMDTPVKWYSTGMFARLGFSVAVHTNPDVLLVDEILSVGDVGFQRKCFDKMTSFKNQGTTIVFVSHNLQAVASLCDNAIVLNRGCIKKAGSAEEIVTYYLREFCKTSEQSSALIYLDKWSLRNEKEEDCSTFACGQRAKVDISLRFEETFSNIYITASVLSNNGTLVFWTDSASLSGHPLSVSKGQHVFFSVSLNLNLSPGEYELRTTIFDRVANQTIFRETLSYFVMQKNIRSGGGICFLEPHLNELSVSVSQTHEGS